MKKFLCYSRKMKVKNWYLYLGVGVALVAILAMLAPRSSQKLSTAYVHEKTTTVFFHGYGSSSHAEKHMAAAAVKAGVTKTVIKADVSKKGRVTFSGKITSNDSNPIVLVNYRDNRNADYHRDADYAQSVLRGLKQKFQITSVNLVGHSMGNMSILYYQLDHNPNNTEPTIKKQVNIAGHFNGIIGFDELADVHLDKDGRPNHVTEAYQALTQLRDSKPKSLIKVLNIYGDTGKASDGRVSNLSSQSLGYLMANRSASYQEIKISGKGGHHSKLHENQEVDEALINFLWKKSKK